MMESALSLYLLAGLALWQPAGITDMQWNEPPDIVVSAEEPITAESARLQMDGFAQAKWQHLEELLTVCANRWRGAYGHWGFVIQGMELRVDPIGPTGYILIEPGKVFIAGRVMTLPRQPLTGGHWTGHVHLGRTTPGTRETEVYAVLKNGKLGFMDSSGYPYPVPEVRVPLGRAWADDMGCFYKVMSYPKCWGRRDLLRIVGQFQNGLSRNGTCAHNGP